MRFSTAIGLLVAAQREKAANRTANTRQIPASLPLEGETHNKVINKVENKRYTRGGG